MSLYLLDFTGNCKNGAYGWTGEAIFGLSCRNDYKRLYANIEKLYWCNNIFLVNDKSLKIKTFF
ncbi:MAG: hypothetical protein BGP14_00645 [Sphingobacteriales bacterium 44-15]|nr:MAG: hypothetical protein BGP14_00645 [Sphingobacteriales bacterium 44-15]